MKRLRHPIRAIREPFGTAGLIVACVAIVLALTGAAFAAKGGLTGKQKKEVEKIAKKFQGTGPAGQNGAPGKDGANGTNGTAGKEGTAGKSVETGNATVGECPEGGATVQVAGEAATKKKVCNGKEGSPWTAGGSLPPGKTETGTWAYEKQAGGEGFALAPISFAVPLANGLAANKVHLIVASGKELVFNTGTFETEEVEPTGCGKALTPAGTVEKPTAAAGHLCVYLGTSKPALTPESIIGSNTVTPPSASCEIVDCAAVAGSGSTGAILHAAPGEFGSAYGSWAVTAP